jgi:hypothetical protein
VRALAAEDLLDQVDLGAPERARDRAPDQPPDVLVGDHEGVLAQVADVLADGSHDPRPWMYLRGPINACDANSAMPASSLTC